MGTRYSRRLLSLIFGLFVSLAAGHGWAGEGADNSGGGTVVIENDTVVLADPFLRRAGNEGTFHCQPGERGDLAPALIAELRRAGALLVRYGAASFSDRFDRSFGPEADNHSRYGRSVFIENEVFDPITEYCFVGKLPYDSPMETEALPIDGRTEVAGYTEGNVTWIREDLFRKMSLREQAKLIIHERLHAYAGNVRHGPIADLTNGLGLALSFFNEQRNGKRPRLSDAEVVTLQRLVLQIQHLRLQKGGPSVFRGNPLTDYRVVQNGGGLVHSRTSVHDRAYIGVGSVIGERVAKVAARAVVLNSVFCGIPGDSERGSNSMFRIESGAFLADSEVSGCRTFAVMGPDSRLQGARVVMGWSPPSFKQDLKGGFWLARSARIEFSTLAELGGLTLLQKAAIQHLKVTGDYVIGSISGDSAPPQLELGAGARLENGEVLLRGAPLDSMYPWNWALNHSVPRLTLDAGAVVNLGHTALCSENPVGIVYNGVHRITGLRSARRTLCRSRLF